MMMVIKKQKQRPQKAGEMVLSRDVSAGLRSSNSIEVPDCTQVQQYQSRSPVQSWRSTAKCVFQQVLFFGKTLKRQETLGKSMKLSLIGQTLENQENSHYYMYEVRHHLVGLKYLTKIYNSKLYRRQFQSYESFHYALKTSVLMKTAWNNKCRSPKIVGLSRLRPHPLSFAVIQE